MQVEAAYSTQRGSGYQYELEEGHEIYTGLYCRPENSRTIWPQTSLRWFRSGKNHIIAVWLAFNSLIVTPQNNLVACFEVVNDSHPLAELATIGRITSQGIDINEKARLRLRQKIVERRDSCRDCFCFWSCAGGCLTRVFSPGPNGHLNTAYTAN